jgi:hypothetical protein
MTIPYAIIGGAAVVLTALASGSAVAETRDLSRNGLWVAYGGTEGSGQAICGIRTVGGDGRRIDISQHSGETGIEMALVKDSWAIPPNTPIELAVQFDLDAPRPGQAVGQAHDVVLRMDFAQSVPFMRSLRGGSQVRVSFPSGTEPVWTGGLSGSGRAIDTFNDCRAQFTQPTATQPFSAPAVSTQPFSQPVVATPLPAEQPALPPIPRAATP